MFEELGGLPAHPLLVHVVVVMVPLAAIGMIAIALRPKWQRAYGPVVVAFAGLGFLGAIFAASSGEELEEVRRSAGETISATLRDHVEMGDTAEVLAGIFFLFVVAWFVVTRWSARVGEERAAKTLRKPKAIAVGLLAVAALSGAVATYSVTVTGHNGAKSVWENDQP